MGLSDAQIERFSRQIILPEIGGTGQVRLQQSSVAIAGRDDELVRIVALYVAGAGIGRVALHGRERGALRGELIDLDPDVRVDLARCAFGSDDADVLVACDAGRSDLDRAAAAQRPLVAGGSSATGGWLVVAQRGAACASCAARWWAAERRGGEPLAALHGAARGVIGSLLSLAVLTLRLGLGDPPARRWWRFDAEHSTLAEHPLGRAADCPACATARGT